MKMVPSWHFLSLVTLASNEVNSYSLNSSLPPFEANKHFVGFDLGTSGARVAVIRSSKKGSNNFFEQVYTDSTTYSTSYSDPNSWTESIHTLLSNLKNNPHYSHVLPSIHSICISGTSASCLLVDKRTGVISRPHDVKMYNYDISHTSSNTNGPEYNPLPYLQTRDTIDKYAPKDHTTRATTSTLSKLLHYHFQSPIQPYEVLVHQSDYIACSLFLHETNKKQCGSGLRNYNLYYSDWHNVLKLGYDVQSCTWPDWLILCLQDLGIVSNRDLVNTNLSSSSSSSSSALQSIVLPQVIGPGEPIGKISKSMSNLYNINPNAVIVGGTTDSNAAFIAAAMSALNYHSHDDTDENAIKEQNYSQKDRGGIPYGTAVTSLGSTLAVKMLSRTFVQDSEKGVYSHRFPAYLSSSSNEKSSSKDGQQEKEAWLVGGASNVGCAILRKEQFTDDELINLSQEMDIATESPYDYYPLTKMGERFPIADPKKEPILDPKPSDRVEYLKGILYGISRIEKFGYDALGKLGADPPFPTVIWTCGGGSKNEKWLLMREKLLHQGRSESSILGASDPESTQASSEMIVRKANNSEASFGAAILAASSFE